MLKLRSTKSVWKINLNTKNVYKIKIKKIFTFFFGKDLFGKKIWKVLFVNLVVISSKIYQVYSYPSNE